FFQAEDGIRDFHVTGVQTCALPIFAPCCWLAATTRLSSRARYRCRCWSWLRCWCCSSRCLPSRRSAKKPSSKSQEHARDEEKVGRGQCQRTVLVSMKPRHRPGCSMLRRKDPTPPANPHFP